ncbi:hypothetical protein AGABI1DRAFT_95090 [Agaricus bisporus var. burnettii JB137-S8]|uniref:DUF4219 domain-containing protein n=1 Tax=Agaricus bisporus var. burnettii (strain JB137-S8 / ATCC MYA-4627 / FGSC 10392) TaxID=597362 RepID=K5WIQ3_AGABU|nr:uncharacterized protein AGABI1DRAFT_95090 [Agaricus bisporus var. burnettii JB137-S8]EKM75136.1 hypothetical protein AGABI1DRAFT_95090 [Agaricus bisporus var. burnettii JB137-S8]
MGPGWANIGTNSNALPKLSGAKNYDTWARRVKNALILIQHKDSTLTAWDVSGSSHPLPTLPTDPTELAKENAIRMTLKLQATVLIESTLPDHMIQEEFNSPRDLWGKMKLNYGVRGPTFVYERLQSLLNFKVQDTQDPSGQIAEFVATCSQITATGATLHDSLQTMMLLSALLARMESTIGIILASAAKVSDLTIEKARATITAAWRNPQNLAAARFKPSGQAPRWQNATPGTSGQNQQQQQRPHGQQQQRQQAPQGAKPDVIRSARELVAKARARVKEKPQRLRLHLPITLQLLRSRFLRSPFLRVLKPNPTTLTHLLCLHRPHGLWCIVSEMRKQLSRRRLP